MAAHPTTQDDTNRFHKDGSFTVKVQLMVGSGSTMEMQLTADTSLGDFAEAVANKWVRVTAAWRPRGECRELPHKTQPGVAVGEKGVKAGMTEQKTRRPANVG
mmetsp:Transcript_42563/g.106253  ORF Transcript_42563/g.106253 Transcript_42563/m.106253 type:complete len:103 (-) Transcript_42563:162-470(-)